MVDGKQKIPICKMKVHHKTGLNDNSTSKPEYLKICYTVFM